MPGGYGEILNWLVAAIGAALLLGTGGALVTYRRTGTFPGDPAGRASKPGTAGGTSRQSIRTAVAKCVLGALLIGLGLVRLIGGGTLQGF